MKLPFKVISQSQRRAQVTMRLPFGSSFRLSEIGDELAPPPSATHPAVDQVGGAEALIASQEIDPSFDSVEEIRPVDSDFIRPQFRALSQALVECYCLDWSKKGVLEAAVPMLEGQTVYKNHSFYDVERWLGVISRSWWDAKGEASDGVPGINVELMIDAKLNPRIARGLMMRPPAIHSFSLTVLFEFEYSHPDLHEEGRFWSLLGEEVAGEIVRLIVTKILAIWEGSLVFQGADTRAKQLPGDEDAASQSLQAGAGGPTHTQEGRTTVKLNDTRKAALGITGDGEDFDDELVLRAMDGLASQAASGRALTEARRAECLTLAKLVECGSGEDTLDPALAEVINGAEGTKLEGLYAMYSKKAAKLFTATCPDCGKTGLQARSSVEDRMGQPQTDRKPQAPSRPSSVF